MNRILIFESTKRDAKSFSSRPFDCELSDRLNEKFLRILFRGDSFIVLIYDLV